MGIRTGDGLVVVDVDPRHGGHLALDQLQAQHGRIPSTPQVLTGGGKAHLCFRGPMDLRSFELAPGLEVKASGCQIAAPPSLHPETGRPYA